MNPIPTLGSLWRAVRDWLLGIPRLILAGWLTGLCLVVVVVVQISLAPWMVDHLPSAIQPVARVWLGFAVLAMVIWSMGISWLRVDHVFYVAGRQRRFFPGAGQALSTGFLLGSYLLGLGAICWVALLALPQRIASVAGLAVPPEKFDPSLLLHPSSAPASYLLVLGLVLLLFSPLIVRLPMLPVAAVIEEESTKSTWKLVVRTSRSRGVPIAAAFVVQLVVVLAGYRLYTLVGSLLPDSGYLLVSVPVETIFSLTLVGGSVLSLLAALQVALVRHFAGLPTLGDEGSGEQNFQVQDPAKKFMAPEGASEQTPRFEAVAPNALAEAATQEEAFEAPQAPTSDPSSAPASSGGAEGFFADVANPGSTKKRRGKTLRPLPDSVRSDDRQ